MNEVQQLAVGGGRGEHLGLGRRGQLEGSVRDKEEEEEEEEEEISHHTTTAGKAKAITVQRETHPTTWSPRKATAMRVPSEERHE